MFQLILYALPKFSNPLCVCFNKSVYSIVINLKVQFMLKRTALFGMNGVSEIGPDHPETDIGVALCPDSHIIRFLRAAIVAFGIPSASFDDIPSVRIGRRGPLPAVAPKVNTPPHRHLSIDCMRPPPSIRISRGWRSWRHPWACVRPRESTPLRSAGGRHAFGPAP